jgi:diguanylate cyclase (GGDEF)-like protein
MDITGRKQQEAKVQLLAHHDELTGAANRRRFYDEAQGTLLQAERDGRPFSLLYLDLDDFKGVNDRHGHACGDALLKHVSSTLQALLRQTDLLARFGGDEFVLLLRDTASGEAEAVASRCRAALEGPFVIDGQRLSGVGSLGTVSYPEHGWTIDELLRHADTAMYREKARCRPDRRALEPDEERARRRAWVCHTLSAQPRRYGSASQRYAQRHAHRVPSSANVQ